MKMTKKRQRSMCTYDVVQQSSLLAKIYVAFGKCLLRDCVSGPDSRIPLRLFVDAVTQWLSIAHLENTLSIRLL